jgi:hypothetical protein
MVFVDSDAANLRPGNLLGLPRPARSFGRKGGGAEAESRGRETLAVLVFAQQQTASLDPRPNHSASNFSDHANACAEFYRVTFLQIRCAFGFANLLIRLNGEWREDGALGAIE